MRTIHDPKNLRTTDQMIKIYHTSRSTLKRRRDDAIGTPYEDSFIQAGRKILYDVNMWQEFLEYLNNEKRKERYGITVLRNSKKFA